MVWFWFSLTAHASLLGRFLTSTRPSLPNKLLSNGSHGNGPNTLQLPSNKQSLVEITNEIFGDLMDLKSNSAHNFDDLGILDLGVRGGVQVREKVPYVGLMSPLWCVVRVVGWLWQYCIFLLIHFYHKILFT